jgi:polyhydroxyalkanoic acid synthase PhaR subunit
VGHMGTPSDTTPPAASDAFDLWKQIYEANERAWNGALEQAMSTPAFAESQGKLLETLLNAQKIVRDQMRAYQEALNVPTREDIARLGELIVGLEEKIDQLDDRFESIESALQRELSATNG